MGTFRCLKSKETVNENTGASIGSTTTSTFTLENTPLVAGTLTGSVYDEGVLVNTFTVDSGGVFHITEISTPTHHVTAGTLNIYTGVLTLTWNSSPGTNFCLVSYEGLPVFEEVTMKKFYVSCPRINVNCSTFSNGYVASVTICDQNL